jgi:hypothetical protein
MRASDIFWGLCTLMGLVNVVLLVASAVWSSVIVRLCALIVVLVVVDANCAYWLRRAQKAGGVWGALGAAAILFVSTLAVVWLK